MKHFPLFLPFCVEGLPGGWGKLSILEEERKNNQLWGPSNSWEKKKKKQERKPFETFFKRYFKIRIFIVPDWVWQRRRAVSSAVPGGRCVGTITGCSWEGLQAALPPLALGWCPYGCGKWKWKRPSCEWKILFKNSIPNKSVFIVISYQSKERPSVFLWRKWTVSNFL